MRFTKKDFARMKMKIKRMDIELVKMFGTSKKHERFYVQQIFKKLVSELQGASKMHLAQSKRVQAHVDMMVRADAKG